VTDTPNETDDSEMAGTNNVSKLLHRPWTSIDLNNGTVFSGTDFQFFEDFQRSTSTAKFGKQLRIELSGTDLGEV